MSLWDKLREHFAPTKVEPPADEPPQLRNKAGGMAMIRGVGTGGAEVMDGRVVKTLRVLYGDFWEIDPPQRYVCTTWTRLTGGHLYPPHTSILVVGIRDAALEPLREVGDEERDESAAWLPPVPVVTKAPEHA